MLAGIPSRARMQTGRLGHSRKDHTSQVVSRDALYHCILLVCICATRKRWYETLLGSQPATATACSHTPPKACSHTPLMTMTMVNAEVDKDGKPLVLGGEVECRLDRQTYHGECLSHHRCP